MAFLHRDKLGMSFAFCYRQQMGNSREHTWEGAHFETWSSYRIALSMRACLGGRTSLYGSLQK